MIISRNTRRLRREATRWGRGVVNAGLIGLMSLPVPLAITGCGTTRTELPPAVASSDMPPAPERPDPSEMVQSILTDVAELESSFAQPDLSDADSEVLRFRLDSAIADLTDLLANGGHQYEIYAGLGRAFVLSHNLGRAGASTVALHMFDEAIALDSRDAGAWYHRGMLLIDTGQPAEAAQALTVASEKANAGEFEDLDYQLALANKLAGDSARALAALAPYVDQHPEDEAAQRLLQGLLNPNAEPVESASTGTISLGLEGRSLVDYNVQGATWQVVHQTLGFTLGLPVSWQLVDEQIDDDQGGFVECAAPPVAGADRQWRTDSLTIWAIPLNGDKSVERLQQAYLESFEDVDDVKEASVERLPSATRLSMRRAPFMESPLYGEALVVVTGETGYVVEYWGDAVSHEFAAPQVDAILETFVPASDSSANTLSAL